MSSVKIKPGHVYTICPDCQGAGSLPPIGNQEGAKIELRNQFPRPCDSCGGGGKRFVKLEENSSTP